MVYKDILVSVIFFFSFEANTTMDSLYHVLIIAEKKRNNQCSHKEVSSHNRKMVPDKLLE
jgi:hypothetical protein